MRVIELINRTAFFASLLAASSLGSCSGGEGDQSKNDNQSAAKTEEVVAAVDPMENKGVGPVKHVELGELDEDLAKKGAEIFESKCAACHKFDKRYVGPALQGITEKRTPEWIMNMILNPAEMTQKDPLAKDLLAEYLTQMTFQNLTEEEARAVLEHFRYQDSKK